MKRRFLALFVTILSLGLAIGIPAPAEAKTTAKPSSISGVTAVPGPGVGEITITWKSQGKNTNHFRIETALSNFSPSKSSPLPARGRSWRMWALSAKARKVVLTRNQLASIGMPLESADHLYFRITPYNKGGSGWRAGSGASTKSMYAKPLAPQGKGSAIRVASFNVRSAPSSAGTSRAWAGRATKVAQTILSRSPGIVTLQEVSPGSISTAPGALRQTEDLVAKLHALGGTSYAMVRTTSYVKSDVPMGTQGSRILYDSSRYTLVSSCPDKTGNYNYSGSCVIIPPIMPGENGSNRRPAAVARFTDNATGTLFWVASVHLDNRDGAKYEAWRATEVASVYNAIKVANPTNAPVIIGGDFNSWQNNDPYNNEPHAWLVNNGFYDLAAATTKVNTAYATMNHFDTTLRKSGSVEGSRLDNLLVKGVSGASRFENVLAPSGSGVSDSRRASDHNMIVADFRLN